MPDYNLLQSSARVPMSVTPLTMNTPVENQSKRLTMEGKEIEVAQARQELDDGTADRTALKGLMASPDVDFATPTGLKNLLERAKGQVSPKTYMDLVANADKVTRTQIANQDALLKLPGEVLDQRAKQMEALAPALDQGRTAYYKDLAEKGETTATANLRDFMGKLTTNTKGMLLPNGQPLYGAELVNSLPDMDAQHMDSILAGSKYLADQTKQAYVESQTRRQRAEADVLENGGKSWDSYQAPDGTIYRQSKTNGQIVKQDMTTGALVPVNAMPAGIQKMGAATQSKKPEIWRDSEGNTWAVLSNTTVLKNGTDELPISALPTNVKKMGSKGAGEAAEEISPENLQYIAEYTAATGKPVPGIPAGVGNNNARTRYLNAFAQVGRDKGYEGTEAGTVAQMRDAAKLALGNLTKQDSIIAVGEKDLVKVMGVMEDELRKIGGPESPKVRALWNHVATDWQGDPQFKGFNAAYANFLDVSAKVLSGQSGAGGTPVSYLELAKKQLGDNPNLKQVVEVNKIMTKLFDARRQAVINEQKELMGKGQMVAKPGSVAEGRAAGSVIPPAVQAERDKDIVPILKTEYNALLTKLAAEKDPTARARLLGDARAARAELKKNKVDVPDPGGAVAVPAADGWKEIAPGVRVRVKPGG